MRAIVFTIAGESRWVGGKWDEGIDSICYAHGPQRMPENRKQEGRFSPREEGREARSKPRTALHFLGNSENVALFFSYGMSMPELPAPHSLSYLGSLWSLCGWGRLAGGFGGKCHSPLPQSKAGFLPSSMALSSHQSVSGISALPEPGGRHLTDIECFNFGSR